MQPAGADGEEPQVQVPLGNNISVPFFEQQASAAAFEGTFMEYNELMIQFGYMTMFAVAFPLAAVFALINNIIEIKVDATKMVYGVQRAKYEGANNIGTWMSVLIFMANCSIVTNIALVCFTSTQLRGDPTNREDVTFQHCTLACEDEVYMADITYANWLLNFTLSDGWLAAANATTQLFDAGECMRACECKGQCLTIEARFLIFAIAEHLMFGARILIDYLIPDVPKSVARAMLWKDYMYDKIKSDAAERSEGGGIKNEEWDLETDLADPVMSFHIDPPKTKPPLPATQEAK